MTTLDEFSRGLLGLAGRYGIPLSDAGLAVCLKHFETLWKWNRAINLVGDLTVETAVFRHYGESLFLASQLPKHVGRICDFGSGGGFPAIGVAATYSKTELVLCEVRQKKSVFLREAFRSVEQVSVHAGDALEVPGKIELVCARAVNPVAVLDFADTKRVAVGLLIADDDAARLTARGKLHRHWHIVPVPWRLGSVAAIGLLQG